MSVNLGINSDKNIIAYNLCSVIFLELLGRHYCISIDRKLVCFSKLKSLFVSTEEPDAEYKVLPWKATREEIKQWLIDQGYGG